MCRLLVHLELCRVKQHCVSMTFRTHSRTNNPKRSGTYMDMFVHAPNCTSEMQHQICNPAFCLCCIQNTRQGVAVQPAVLSMRGIPLYRGWRLGVKGWTTFHGILPPLNAKLVLFMPCLDSPYSCCLTYPSLCRLGTGTGSVHVFIKTARGTGPLFFIKRRAADDRELL